MHIHLDMYLKRAFTCTFNGTLFKQLCSEQYMNPSIYQIPIAQILKLTM